MIVTTQMVLGYLLPILLAIVLLTGIWIILSVVNRAGVKREPDPAAVAAVVRHLRRRG